MVISRTPYRVSFFGGGTDFPAWYLNQGGCVLSTSIDKYCYITARDLPPFFDHNLRVVYSKIENCSDVEDIQHPSVRETLKFMGMKSGLEIHHDGDLPARSGMGSSSSFTVGLLNALYALSGRAVTPRQLADDSIFVEQKMIREVVGSQDQIAAAYGGLNHVEFKKNGDFCVTPVDISTQRKEELNSHLMLFYTGIQRTSSDVARTYVEQIGQKKILLGKMQKMVGKGIDILTGNGDIHDFGELLHEAWVSKRSLSMKVSNPLLDQYYSRAKACGAVGGKITGAGGGGFFMLFAAPERHAKIISELKELLHIPFRFDSTGSKVLFNESSDKVAGESLFPIRKIVAGGGRSNL